MSGPEVRQRMSWGIGIALGMCTGVALGSALDNMSVGLALGVSIGVVFAVVFGALGRGKRVVEDDGADPDDDVAGNSAPPHG